MPNDRKLSQTNDQVVDPRDRQAIEPQDRVQDHIDPEHRVHGRHHEKRRDQQDPHNAPSGEAAVHQYGDQQPEDNGEDQNADDDEDAVLYCEPKVFGFKHILIVPQSPANSRWMAWSILAGAGCSERSE